MIILGTNSIKDTGYDVDNSARFETNTYMTKTASSGNTKTFTISFWTKRSALGAVASGSNQFPISFYQNGDNRISFAFLTDNTFIVYAAVGGADKMNFTTNRVFRDTSAWYHVVIKVDTTQGTEANRFKMYINGVQETSFSTATYPSQNDDLIINTNIYLGTYDTSNNFFHGYLAEVVYADGQALDATSFGEFDEDSGIWKPIDVSGLTAGTNGFYLDFEASGNLGNDAFGGTDLTENNLTATDQSTDTCTNNFATMNPLDVSLPSTFALSEGNLDTLMNGINSNDYPRAYSNIQVASGKWYVECKITEEEDSGAIGISARSGTSYVNVGGTNYDWLGINAHDYRYYHDGTKMNNNSSSSYGTTWDGGDTIGIALDMDNLAVYFSLNGTFQASGDPTSGSSRTNAAFNLTAVDSTPNGFYKFAFGTQGGTAVQGQWNFGSPPYAISSGNTDGNGYGNMEYAVPSGYYVLNSKNLSEYG